ncbi:MAG: formate dehydrogenase accessory protein FdhE [Firmicutes bacterium]|jgi:FdhE protein|nr:formate dehydrogenase accessory protein FdhE [Bacillota bacterium]
MGNLQEAIKDWIKDRPYLREVAKLQETIATVIEGNSIQEHQAGYDWKNVVPEIKKGIPVLKAIKIDSKTIENAADLLIDIVDALAAASLPEKMVQHCQKMQSVLLENAELAGHIIAEVIESNSVQPNDPSLGEIDEGFIVFLAWSSLSEALKPLKSKVTELLKDNKWRRGYCPVCGQLPAMGQLVRVEKDRGRERELVCGCCQMRWQYRRIGCPYCDNLEQETLKIIEVAEEPDLRIDTCEKCRSYLKIYTNEGNEQVILADWSTLHLDLIGEKNGFKRTGYRMYGL